TLAVGGARDWGGGVDSGVGAGREGHAAVVTAPRVVKELALRRRLAIPLIVVCCCASAWGAPPRKTTVGSKSQTGPRASAAFSPDGKLLAIAGYREVVLRDLATGRSTRLGVHAGEVTCVAFSPDGKTLAASGGVPGRSGEIRLWNAAARTSRVLTGVHTDVVYSVAWSPDGKALAAGGYDRLVSLWDVATGKGRTLKDHTDSVYSVAFNRDGTRIASAAGDRTVKLWDPATGKRLFTLSDSTAELYSVAFHPSGGEVAAAGVDKMLRKWSLTPTAGALARSAFAHEGPILRVVYSPDGTGIFTTSEDRSIRLWDAGTLAERKVFERQPDWALGLAVSPGGKLLAVTRYDGSTALYDALTGDRKTLAASVSEAR
ncbi:MAG: WD40 repeat domain-containing protein, partial [Actinomycetota bacterium]